MATTSPVLAIPVPEPADADDISAIVGAVATRLDSAVVSKAGGSTITPSAVGVKGLVVKGVSGQTANLQEWQDNAGTTKAQVAANGVVGSKVQVAAGDLTLNLGTFVQAVSTDPTSRGLVVRGAPAQVANLAEFQNSSGTVLTSVDGGGYLHVPSIFFTNVDTTPSAGAAAGFLVFSINGATAKIPYYAA